MTKIKIKTMVETTKKIEVDLPVYFKGSDTFDGGGGYDCVIRINEDGKSAHYLSVDFDGEWNYYLTSNVGQFFLNMACISKLQPMSFSKWFPDSTPNLIR